MTAGVGSGATELDVRHVRVPLDGSEFALRAMPTARVLAERFGAELHTVTVARADDDVERLRAHAAAALGVDAADDRAFVVAGGEPAEVIVQRARERGSCVICLASVAPCLVAAVQP